MSTQVRALLAVALATLILFGGQYLLPRRPEETPDPSKKEAIPAAAKPAASSSSEGSSLSGRLQERETSPRVPEREVIVETGVVKAILTSRGGALKSWQLKPYSVTDGQEVDLVALQPEDLTGPLTVSSGSAEQPAPLDFDIDKAQLNLRGSSETGAILLSSRGNGPLRLSKRLTFKGNSYRVEVALSWKNAGKEPMTIAPELAWGPGFYGGRDDRRTQPLPPTSWVDGRRVTDDLGGLQGIATHKGQVSWTALQNLYFAAALLPGDKGSVVTVRKGPQERPIISLATSAQSLQPGGELTQRFALYGGPKDIDQLKAAGSDLTNIVDLGWFDTLARPALHLLRFLHRLSGNYGVAIILVSLLQKVALHPLTAKSLRSMQAMKSLQPKIAAITERLKNNPQKKQQEVMALYRKHGVNPLGGCLPMLVQIPIFVALYNALSSSVEMWQAHFLWIKDLSQPDALFTINLWGLQNYPFNLLAIFMGASMFLQQKMSPSVGDPQQAQIMLYMMPVMFIVMFWTFPSGLVLYWLVNNVLQVGQQHWLQKQGKLTLRGPEAA